MATVISLARKSSQRQIKAIKLGLPASTLPAIAGYLGFTQKELASSLDIELRTTRKRSASGKRLRPQESEKYLRVARVLALGIDVLGSQKKAAEWVVSRLSPLGGRRPIDLLETDIGAQEVTNVLQAIKWGVYL